jgi:inorganic triphosphatase YgiF
MMKIENQKKIEELKDRLKTAVKARLEYIQNQYSETEKEARNIHLAAFRTTDHEIASFIAKIDETLAQFTIKEEEEWVKDKEEKAETFFDDLKGLK